MKDINRNPFNRSFVSFAEMVDSEWVFLTVMGVFFRFPPSSHGFVYVDNISFFFPCVL